MNNLYDELMKLDKDSAVAMLDDYVQNAFSDGYQDGHEDGYQAGYDVGYDFGYNSGSQAGYWEGKLSVSS